MTYRKASIKRLLASTALCGSVAALSGLGIGLVSSTEASARYLGTFELPPGLARIEDSVNRLVRTIRREFTALQEAAPTARQKARIARQMASRISTAHGQGLELIFRPYFGGQKLAIIKKIINGTARWVATAAGLVKGAREIDIAVGLDWNDLHEVKWGDVTFKGYAGDRAKRQMDVDCELVKQGKKVTWEIKDGVPDWEVQKKMAECGIDWRRWVSPGAGEAAPVPEPEPLTPGEIALGLAVVAEATVPLAIDWWRKTHNVIQTEEAQPPTPKIPSILNRPGNLPGVAITPPPAPAGAKYSFVAIANANDSTGGTAVAAATVTITKSVTSSGDGIGGLAAASANGSSISGNGNGGTAAAPVTITNLGAINSGGNGIDGLAVASANGESISGNGNGGTAYATVGIINSGAINSGGNGIDGLAAASANGSSISGNGNGGTAAAKVTITNSGAINSGGNGIDGTALASANGSSISGYGSGGTAAATVEITNKAPIASYGVGIIAIAEADPTGPAAAVAAVQNSGNIVTTGDGSPGIIAQTQAQGCSIGPPNCRVQAVTTMVNQAQIVTNGTDSPAAYLQAKAQAPQGQAVAEVVLTNSGAILTTGVSSDAIDASVSAPGGNATITLNNFGMIGASASPYHAIVARGGSTTINNSGQIRGNVQLQAFNNTFNNLATGVWAMQDDSDFGGNPATAMNNSGTVTMVVPSTVTLYGLQNFNNTGGLITMVNGQPGDRIVIESAAGTQVNFNGSGASQLAVDAFLGGPGSTADVLQVGGSAGQGSVSGVTQVIVNDSNPGLGSFNPVGIPVAESGGAVTSTANTPGNFDLPAGPIHKGLFDYTLFYLPQSAANNPCAPGFNCWFLASAPSTPALELARLPAAAQDVWVDAAGLWLDHNADLRDYCTLGAAPAAAYSLANASADLRDYCNPGARPAAVSLGYAEETRDTQLAAAFPVKAPPQVAPIAPTGAGYAVWMRAFGDWATNHGTANFTEFGQTFSHNVNYDQKTGGVQIGLDYLAYQTAGSALFVGVLDGAVDSRLTFASGSDATFRGGNIGVHATYLNRGWFADALFLANFMSVDFTALPVSGLTTIGMDVRQAGGHFDTGYRFQFNPWFVEPMATVEVVHTAFCGSSALSCNGSAVTLPGATLTVDETSVRGRLGGRIGTTWIANGWRVEPSLTGGVWQTFTGDNSANLTSNGFVLDLTDPNSHRTEGEVGGMLNLFQVGTGLSGFVKGAYRFAKEYKSVSVNGGVRYQW
jgi:Autotransporter beta-domain